MSILVLLLVGVAVARNISYYDDDADGEPMPANWRETRICAELCISGLGGDPCGPSCHALTPKGPQKSPLRNDSSVSEPLDGQTVSHRHKIRNDVCPALCENFLGFPLCECNYGFKPFYFSVDFVKVCQVFCDKYNYRLFGCRPCEAGTKRGLLTSDRMSFPTISLVHDQDDPVDDDSEIDKNKWCPRVCTEGDGGAACYCDLLPLLVVKEN